jgi:hypothetical protein
MSTTESPAAPSHNGHDLWTRLERWPLVRRLTIVYSPACDDRSFLDAAQTQQQDGIEVSVAVLDPQQSRRYFGVPMARRGIQPVWIRVVNRAATPCRLIAVGVDPNYYSPHEAAAANHYAFGKRLLGFGLLGWLFLPLLLLVPLKLIGAWRANRKMDELFREQAFHLRAIPSGSQSEGFIYGALDVGNRVVHAQILRIEGPLEFIFNVPVAGIDVDYERREFAKLYAPEQLVECDFRSLCERLRAMPRAVTNVLKTREGDPANLVVIGDFPSLLSAFGARWDETETITLATCWKTFRAFLIGTEYRYSPVSPLYLFGRSQDFALQRIRRSINERLHLRLWLTELRFDGKPVWVGQVSRDIGVRFTHKTWNLTTHRIDPDVDESRDYVLEDLLAAERLELAGYVGGVGECQQCAPRRNLTGDPYFTDGDRGIAVVSPSRTTMQFVGRM